MRLLNKKTSLEDTIKIAELINNDIKKYSLTMPEVINACQMLSEKLFDDDIFFELIDILKAMGYEFVDAKEIILGTAINFKKEVLYKKLEREFLTIDPFKKEVISKEENIYEVFYPLGVLTHITASNHPSIPINSLIEGLLTCNINIIKMPSSQNLFAKKIIELLIDCYPMLSHFIYVLNFSSSETSVLKSICNISDCVIVWGSDSAVSGIRKLVSHNKKVISFGHKISFSYISCNCIHDSISLHNLAHEICSTNQLLCSSPQCIFVESGNKNELNDFAQRFYSIMKKVSHKYKEPEIDINTKSEISMQVLVAKTSKVLEETAIFEPDDKSFHIIVEYESKLAPSPLFRTIYIRPIKRNEIIDITEPMREYLQTVSLACTKEESQEIIEQLLKSGITRICPCGQSRLGYIGEPHDGIYPMREYVKRVKIQL